MRTEYIFPTVLIALDVCAAMPYAWHGNLRMMVYWLAAATKNTDARLTRVEATVARFSGWRTICRPPPPCGRSRGPFSRAWRDSCEDERGTT